MKKISQLESLVDIDKADHKIKDMAKLFVTAANDWDSPNQTDISEFVKEVTEYFGSPLTKEKIGNKFLEPSGNNAWRLEAGNSLIEILEISGHANFDDILQRIISYYDRQSLSS